MLAKTNRLTTKEFATIYQSGKTFHGTYFVIKVLHAEQFKAGVSISKKVYKTAVARNRLKRQVYAALWPYLHTSLQIVVIAKKSIGQPTFTDLQNDMKGVLDTISV